jgi:hypothetical protein
MADYKRSSCNRPLLRPAQYGFLVKQVRWPADMRYVGVQAEWKVPQPVLMLIVVGSFCLKTDPQKKSEDSEI